jgi:8-oxo-dGTP diphosphatase
MNGSSPALWEGASAILIGTDGRLLLQLRDIVPNISDPGKLSCFGGGREGDESFLDCVVREVHEEIGLYIPPERFEFLGRYRGPHHWRPNHIFHGEFFVARNIPVDQLSITEGTLRIVALDELIQIQDLLSPPAKYALDVFLNREQAT